MTLIFIENRYKTFFYDAIVKNLINDGHEIFWIIQNQNFKPKFGKKYVIQYPKEKNLPINEKKFRDVITSDRQLNYFNKKDKTYIEYYYSEINRIIEQVKPQIVFGESTAFHELLAIQVCKEKKILYLNPCSSRYPVGRFSFYKFDTLKPYYGSNNEYSYEEAKMVINSIINRNVKPDYMVPKKKAIFKTFKNKIKLISSYYLGEKYNTPSPIIKFKKERELTKNITKWQSNSIKVIDATRFSVLYPMQMQPEANIGVWGRKYRNQLTNIKQIYKQLKNGENLYIKLNPKCKYELTSELISFINSKKNIIPLNLNLKMEDVLPKIDLVITVTGTIAIENIFINKPVVTMVKTINNTNKNCFFLDNFNELSKQINIIKLGKFSIINLDEKVNFINLLKRTSFKGIVSNPFDDLISVSKGNIENMTDAFRKIIKIVNNS